MITLIEAFRLCKIADDEFVYLKAADDKSPFGEEELFSSKAVRKTFDMKKLKVVEIRPLFERFGPDYLGIMFTVRGITTKELHEKHFRMWQ